MDISKIQGILDIYTQTQVQTTEVQLALGKTIGHDWVTKEQRKWNELDTIIQILTTIQEPISYTELQTLLQLSDTVFKGDLRVLRGRGYDIKRRKGYLQLLSLQHDELYKVSEYEPATNDSVSQFLMSSAVPFLPIKSGVNGSTIITKEHSYDRNTLRDILSDLDLLYSDYSFKETLRTSRAQGLVDYHKENHTYQTNLNYSFHVIPNEDYLKTIFRVLDYPAHLVNILHQLGFSGSHPSSGANLLSIRCLFQRLESCDYLHKAISLKYTGNNWGKTATPKERVYPYFRVGLICYEQDRDMFYLIGRTKPLRKNEITSTKGKNAYEILRLNQIIIDSIECAKNLPAEVDTSTFKKECRVISSQMFDISVDKPNDIVIDFDVSTKKYIIEDIMRLASRRRETATVRYYSSSGTSLSPKTLGSFDEIIRIRYTDTIRGLGSFASYLRQYGDSITIISDTALRKQFLDTARRSIAEYESNTNGGNSNE